MPQLAGALYHGPSPMITKRRLGSLPQLARCLQQDINPFFLSSGRQCRTQSCRCLRASPTKSVGTADCRFASRFCDSDGSMPLGIKLTLWGGQPITLMSSSWMPGRQQ